MSEAVDEQQAQVAQQAAVEPRVEQVESPPKVKVVEEVKEDPKAQLVALAGEVAKRGSRKLLWEYLRLRSRVMGK